MASSAPGAERQFLTIRSHEQKPLVIKRITVNGEVTVQEILTGLQSEHFRGDHAYYRRGGDLHCRLQQANLVCRHHYGPRHDSIRIQGGTSVSASQKLRYVDWVSSFSSGSKPSWRSARILRTSIGARASFRLNVGRETDFIRVLDNGIVCHIKFCHSWALVHKLLVPPAMDPFAPFGLDPFAAAALFASRLSTRHYIAATFAARGQASCRSCGAWGAIPVRRRPALPRPSRVPHAPDARFFRPIPG